jgi:hypothetical protein
MVVLECSDGVLWTPPDTVITHSPLLLELAMVELIDHPQVHMRLVEPYAACCVLERCQTMFLPANGTPLAVIAAARRLATFFGMPEPPALARAMSLVVMDIVHASRVASPYDAAACLALSEDLAMAFPTRMSPVRSTTPCMEVMQACMRENTSIADRARALVGAADYAATILPMVRAYRTRHRRPH